MIFKNPQFLLLLLFIPAFLFRKKSKSAGLLFSSSAFIRNAMSTFRLKAYNSLLLFRMITVALFIIALARPQMPITNYRVFKEGIDIVLALDVSTSMEALDFKIQNKRYNRLHVVKKVVEEFIAERPNDRIGMIAFAGRPYTVCPLSLDHNWLLSNLERVKIGMVEDGTAIGSSITAALNRLRQSTAKTKIIILLTDGRNNAGKISPLTAAEAAKALGVKIYTIGAGSSGAVPYPAHDLFGRQTVQFVEIEMDEASLQKIAQTTEGKYFRATDTASLRKIYEQINKLQTTPFQQPVYMYYDELFSRFVLWGLILFLLEQILASTLLVKIP